MNKNNYLIDQLSVFFPAYNEEGNIKKTVLRSIQVLKEVAEEWEVLIINDGSKDKTLQIAEKIAKTDNRIKVINHPENKGYGAALRSGFYNAKYSWVAFTDADGQFDFSEIKNFIKTQKRQMQILLLGIIVKGKFHFIGR